MRLKLLKDKEVGVRRLYGIHCDFCGDKTERKEMFTSDFDDCDNPHKCNMQICDDCVKQLNKFIAR